MPQQNQPLPVKEIVSIAICLVVAYIAFLVLFVKKDPVKPPEARAGGASYVPSPPEPDRKSAKELESEWISDARAIVSKMGHNRSNQIAGASGLDVEWDFWGEDAEFMEMNGSFAYFLYKRAYKVTVKGTRLRMPMLITYRCWGEKIQCEMLRSGDMNFKR